MDAKTVFGWTLAKSLFPLSFLALFVLQIHKKSYFWKAGRHLSKFEVFLGDFFQFILIHVNCKLIEYGNRTFQKLHKGPMVAKRNGNVSKFAW